MASKAQPVVNVPGEVGVTQLAQVGGDDVKRHSEFVRGFLQPSLDLVGERGA